jgi:sugar (pentulose or hexulose) kinase
VRAAVAAPALALCSHSLWIGSFDTIRVTGGASKSPGIRQTLANVFQARVESIAVEDSAALGGAMIAAHCDGVSLEKMTEQFTPVGELCEPDADCAELYRNLLPLIKDLEGSDPID